MNTLVFPIAAINTNLAKIIVDSYTGVGPYDNITLLEKALYRLSGDKEEMQKIHEIASNTVNYCNIILMPGSNLINNQMGIDSDQIKKAKKEISRYRHIAEVTKDIV